MESGKWLAIIQSDGFENYDWKEVFGYAGERGLFGKVKGVFWWDMSVRGNADHGVVEKDYHIAGEAKL